MRLEAPIKGWIEELQMVARGDHRSHAVPPIELEKQRRDKPLELPDVLRIVAALRECVDLVKPKHSAGGPRRIEGVNKASCALSEVASDHVGWLDVHKGPSHRSRDVRHRHRLADARRAGD